MYSEHEEALPYEVEDAVEVEETGEEDEEVVEEVVEEEGQAGTEGDSLLNRLWTTKVISWDNQDGTLPSNEVDQVEQVDPVRLLKEGDDSSLRHNALFISCDGFSKMDTTFILKVLSEAFENAVEIIPTPVGLEWVDDSTVVIVWSSEFGSRAAFLHLTGTLLDEDYPLELLPTCPLGRWNASHDAFVRLALASDVKKKGAAAKSKFYKSRQESRKPYSQNGRRSRANKDDLDAELEMMRGSQASKDDLDAELDKMAEDRDAEL